MNDLEDIKNYNLIRGIIDKEIENTEDFYNESELKNDLLNNMESLQKPKPDWVQLFNKPVFALGVIIVAVLLAFSGKILFDIQKGVPNVTQLKKVFTAIPFINQENDLNQKFKIKTDETFVNNLSWKIKRGIYASSMKDYTSEDIKALLVNSLFFEKAQQERKKNGDQQKIIKKMNFEVRLNNLIKNKKLEQFFYNNFKKQEGV